MVFHATLGSGFVRLASMALSFLVGVQLARYLGVAEYGIYGAIMSGVAIASTVIGLGVPPLASREAAIAVSRRDWPQLRGIVRWSLAVVGGIGCLAWGVAAAGLLSFPGMVPDDLRFGVLVALPLVLVLALISVVAALLRGAGRLVGGQLFDGILLPALFALALASAFLLSDRLNAETALALQLVAAFVTAVAAGAWLAILLRRRATDARAVMRGQDWLRGAIPMGLTDVLRVLDAHLSVLILAMMVPVADVGLFRVALSCAVFVALPYSLFGTIAVPIVARLVTEGNSSALQRFASAASLSGSAAILVALLALWFVGEPLIKLVFGGEYAGAWSVLMILGLAHLLTATNGIAAGILTATGNERSVTRAFAASVAAGFAAVLALGWLFGIVGAAWAVVLAAAVRTALLHRSSVRLSGTNPSIFSFGELFGRQGVRP